jgi:hypothetical protein
LIANLIDKGRRLLFYQVNLLHHALLMQSQEYLHEMKWNPLDTPLGLLESALKLHGLSFNGLEILNQGPESHSLS